MTRAEIYAGAFFPAKLQWQNILSALFEYNMLRYLLNSTFFTVTIVLLNLFFCSIVGFALAKYDFPGKQVLFACILIAMMIPPIIFIVPLFLEVKAFGWLNTPLALIIPGFIDPFGIFLMRQFIIDIEDDYLDAARIDGVSEFGIFWRIIVPFSIPAISALALYRFFIVFYNDHSIPHVAEFAESMQQLAIVTLVQADAGLIKDVQDAHEATADLTGEADSLPFSSRESASGAIKGQIV